MKNFVLFCGKKTKPILQFIVRSSWFVAKTMIGYLKKQSQFVTKRNSVKYYTKGTYGNTPACGAQKNKANNMVHGS